MKTVEEIYENMKADFSARAGYEISDSSDMAVRMYASAAQICSLYAYNDWVKNQAFPQTASGVNLDFHAKMRGLERRGGAKAEGKITFYTDEPAVTELAVNAGTVCYTAYGTRFVTAENAVIAVGEVSVDVKAVCEAEGEGGNVSAGTVTYMAVKPIGITACINGEAFSGGYDTETDESLRTRILDSFKTIPNGANAAYYEKEAMSIENVEAVKVLPKNRGLGTVDIIIASYEGVPTDELIAQVKDALDSKREICVDIGVVPPETVIADIDAAIKTKSGYGYTETAQKVRERIEAHFGGRLLGKSVLIAQLGNIIYNTDGVENYVLNSPSADVEAAETVLPVIGTIELSNMAAGE